MYFYRRVLSYLNHEKTFTFFFFSVKKKTYVIRYTCRGCVSFVFRYGTDFVSAFSEWKFEQTLEEKLLGVTHV